LRGSSLPPPLWKGKGKKDEGVPEGRVEWWGGQVRDGIGKAKDEL